MNGFEELVPLLVVMSVACLVFAVLCAICNWAERRSRNRDMSQRTIIDLEEWQRNRDDES